ncbi:hypothetical protein [Sphingomonas sp. MMS24-J13]|uniref:hypothetical protein n=1 Tax=Sphingomonas sp. MMS24-J13 TaxID=3238686 RepID=UPI00384B403E
MRFLVTIDLSKADIAAFDHYERQVVPLLAHYGAEMELRVRSLDRKSEVHLLRFPDDAAHRAFLADPKRQAMRPIMEGSGATSTVVEVEHL